jgi:PAS domain S-box-containing protein
VSEAGALVLIVDDSEAGRYATARMLGRAGFRVAEASTAAAGLECMRTELPDVVLLDVNLPDMSGLDMCRRIKEDAATSHILVVQVSASFVRPTDAVRGLEAGADAYLTEPLDPTVLVATVNALLRVRRAEDRERTAAAHLAATFDAIPEGVCLLDANNLVQRCNRAMAEMLGRAPDAIVGHPWSEIVGPWLGRDAGSLPLRVQDTRIRLEAAAGERWYEVAVDAVRKRSGARTGTVCTVADITIRKRGEEEDARLLARERLARSEAEAANRSKDEFLAVLSHELRTPLTAILGWVRTLRLRQPDATALAHGLEVIERNTRMQAQLIEDLLDVSRIVAGKIVLDRRPVPIATIVEAALEGVRTTADSYGVTLELHMHESGLRVEGDPARLQQVVSNLLSNGIKFTPSGGRVDVHVARQADNAVITVRDTGRGISAEFLPFIFDRFRQADGGITRAKGGLGLGLAIVRHIVALHAGTVTAESDGDNRGAIFRVSLPALPEAGTPAATAAPKPATSRLDGCWILVVEDDADTREVVAMVLAGAGAGVKTVSTLAGAESALSAAPWDVLVSDLGMPDGSGHELIRRVRQHPTLARVPAVALSAHAMDTDARLSLDAGFDVHLPKPVEPDKLVRVIASLARRGPLEQRAS